MVAVTRDEETSENRGASSSERLVAPCSGSGFRTNILACCGQVHVLPLRTPGDDYWPFAGKSRSWAARAARLPSWAFQSSIHGSDQKVRAPTAVNKRACRRLGRFPKLQVRGRCGFSGTNDVTEYALAGCPGTKPCLSTSSFCSQFIHTTTTFVKFFGCFYAPCIGRLTE